MVAIIIVLIILFLLINYRMQKEENKEGFWSWDYWYNPYTLTTPCTENVFGYINCFRYPVYPLYYPPTTRRRRYKKIYSYF